MPADDLDFTDFIMPEVGHMQRFNSNTLARLLVSFVPMVDFLHRHRVNPGAIASFGAGSCSHEAFLADIYPAASILCVDMSEKYVPDYTKEKMAATGRMTFQEVKFETLDWSQYDRKFDLVFSIQALEHIDDTFTALENLATAVKPGGYIYVDTPFYSEIDEREDAFYLVEERKRQWEKHSHFHLGFSPYRTAERLTSLGFETIDVGYSSYAHGGDNSFLHFIRTDAFNPGKASRAYAVGVANTLQVLLTRFEEMNANNHEKIENCRHKGRAVMAMRVLAQRAL